MLRYVKNRFKQAEINANELINQISNRASNILLIDFLLTDFLLTDFLLIDFFFATFFATFSLAADSFASLGSVAFYFILMDIRVNTWLDY